MRIEHVSAFDISNALQVCVESVKCEFEVNRQKFNGIVHKSLPDYHFLVSDINTKLAYVVEFRDINFIEYEV